MLKLSWKYYPCIFNKPGGTSRGVLHDKPSWIIKVTDTETEISGYGEVSLIPKLSPEKPEDVPQLLQWLEKNIHQPKEYLFEYLERCPAMCFGLETALLDLEQGGKRHWFNTPFTLGKAGIPINGLIWMNDFETMKRDVDAKIDAGFRCIKIKVGALNISEELKLVAYTREQAPNITIRLDANGAFAPSEAQQVLETFAPFNIHSIEQPIAAGQHEAMAQLVKTTPIPIALDEELIGIYDPMAKDALLQTIKPHYIILKPSLVGGLQASNSWIQAAEQYNVKWWATSALETNVGLAAIAQWAANKKVKMPQGLGTGKVFTNNIPSPMQIQGERLWNGNSDWQLPL